MNKLISVAGVLTFAIGAVMYLLLSFLRMETYRAALLVYEQASLGVAGVGVAVLVVGLFVKDRPLGDIDTQGAARLFIRLAIINTVAAAVFATPVLDPRYEFPILITRWPGIYMAVAYTFFVLVGVLGMLGWGVVFYLLPNLFGKASIGRILLFIQVAATEVGVYAFAVFMFLGGYIGAQLVYFSGAGDFIVGASMEPAVIPSAIGIFLLILGPMVGIVNVLLAKGDSQPPQERPS